MPTEVTFVSRGTAHVPSPLRNEVFLPAPGAGTKPALPAAEAVVDAGYNLYTIGIYGNVDRMEDITTDAGAPAENYYSASDTAALQAAFGEILSKYAFLLKSISS